jgi:hypothetical protein
MYLNDIHKGREAFSEIKGFLRKVRRSFEALVQATGTALSTVTKEDAQGFFIHCGYGMPRILSL